MSKPVALKKHFVVLLICLAVAPLAARRAVAQVGVSSASFSMGRAGLAPDPDAILVEEYFNFHRHHIASPKAGEAIGFDVRWGADRIGQSREAVLQVGLATREAPVNREMPLLNLALVIDRSGSMSGDRIANVKKSILAFIERLRPADRVSIVAFNHEAHVVLEAGAVTNPDRLREVIESISAGGSTDIHQGLMLGYKQVSKCYDPEKTNRVILLTDGRTNSGVTDEEQIAGDSLAFNKKGIDVSMIGLGHDLNHQLLRQLAKAGRGLIHFVDNDKDIRKIFIEELESLLSPVAREVVVEIEYDGTLECEQFFGYEPQLRKNRIVVSLDDLNHHATQVLLVRFRAGEGAKLKKGAKAVARLQYRDIASGEKVCLEQTVHLAKNNKDKKQQVDPLQDPEVRKNLTIAELAQGIKQMAVSYRAEDYKSGNRHLENALCAARQRFPECQDKDILRVQKIAQTYADRLNEFEKVTKK